MASKHRLLIITTGGTIAGQVASDKIDDGLKRTAQDLEGLLGETIGYQNLRNQLDIDLKVDSSIPGVDSSNILPDHWKQIALMIKDKYDDYESFVITHGTNTLGYTCAALSFALANPNKPIILTGSQVPAGLPGSDALLNLENAIRVATWKREGTQIKGVLGVFGSHIITGTRVKKDTEFDYDAFKSFNTGSVGRIGRIINLNETNLAKHNSYLTTSLGPAARTQADLRCEPEFDMRIASLTEFPGMSPGLFKTLVEKNDIKAFILRAFGAGDPSERHLEAFRFLKNEKIPIVVTTQAPNGNSNFQVNEPGLILRKEKLAIPAYDMGIEAQTTKLAWLLYKKMRGDLSYSDLSVEMIRDIHGEINVMWEVG